MAKSLAKRLGYIYIDSGAMYRAVTYYCLQNNLIKNGVVAKQELIGKLPEIHIEFRINKEKQRDELFLNGENIEEQIRGMEVSDNVSNVSTIQEVRKQMVFLQREMGQHKRIIMDGRDIGTVVFPDADLKIFMTADVEVRAKRRHCEFVNKGENISLEEVAENIRKRDFIDENRDESPLRKADDAMVLDNSYLSKADQLNWIVNLIDERF
jgi:cytidylate kinase